ncbi:hypothetical protein HMPREF1583_01201 [Gardnerella vaginalis JCP8151B]|nr:hypothetical protein HMPREF1582_01442 [Gardnerella vaginalis JCP8151A]EPI45549.1 hypothetical protein HMPREF1583_01201 [Gardnerella vaginalis JCP8151B]
MQRNIPEDIAGDIPGSQKTKQTHKHKRVPNGYKQVLSKYKQGSIGTQTHSKHKNKTT